MFNKLLKLYPTAVPGVDVQLQDDGAGVFISHWNAEKLGEKPSIETIEAVNVAPSTLELDTEKYLKRAGAKNQLMAEMAAMNIGRLKDRTWTTQQLVGLMADPDIVKLIAHMETLSFELAIGVINGITNELVTPAIKATWISRLQAHLY